MISAARSREPGRSVPTTATRSWSLPDFPPRSRSIAARAGPTLSACPRGWRSRSRRRGARRETREAPREQVAEVRVAQRCENEDDGGCDQKQGAKSEVHQGTPFGWHDLYARLSSMTNRVLMQVK